MEARLNGNSEVFSCGGCGKTFDKKKSQTRHSSYCRKRAKYPPRPRKRSCACCTKAKSHCDSSFPTCSRCAKRKLTCVYQHRPADENGSGKQAQTEIHYLDEELPLAILPTCLPPDEGETANCGPKSFAHIDDYLFTGDGQLDNSSFLSLHDLHHEGDSPFANSFSNSRDICPLLSLEFGIEYGNFISFSALGNQPIFQVPRAFKPRMVKCRQLSLNKKFVMCTLQSYPQMLLPGQEPPPFLHTSQEDLPGPLATCSGIVALWSVQNKNNSAFIWRSIQGEQVRLSEQCHTFGDMDIVASLQAIGIYFILRVSELDEGNTNFDIPLISTMLVTYVVQYLVSIAEGPFYQKLALRVREISLQYSQPSLDYPSTWEEWIIAESLQRAIFMIFIVDFLFDLSAGTLAGSCDGVNHLLQMPLPCSKKLWNAKTRFDWEQEMVSQRMLFQMSGNGHSRFLDLMRYSVDSTVCDDNLDRWISDVDEFGLLVLSATSIADDVGFIAQS